VNKKIIHIYHRNYDSYFPPKSSPFYYLAGWSSLLARSTVRNSDRYIIENWRPEKEVNKIMEKEVEGINCRLFPLSKLKKENRFSFSLLGELKKEVKRNLILINLHNIHNIETYIIGYLFKNYPVVAHHHGDIPPSNKKPKSVFNSMVYALESTVERKVLKYIDYFSVISRIEKNYLASIAGDGKIILEQGRIYFDDWKPINKKEARTELGISDEKKVLMYVGKYYNLKGVDIILDTYEKLKNKYNLELVLIGGSPSDPLFNDVKAADVRNYGYIPHHKLPLYYSAADIYLLPSFDANLIQWGGLGTAIIEALACNLPVVSKQLIHFPKEERGKIGEIPEHKEDFAQCITKILNSPDKYNNCRQIAKKYYDLADIIKKNLKIYDGLFRQYYGI